MPTYDYQCGKCGFEFERQQRITEDPIKTCPKCKSRQVKRLLSAPNFILKGGGWYADGYGSTGKKVGSGSDSSSSADSSSTSSSSDSASSASAPAAKPDKTSGASGASGTKKGGKSGESAA
jgi:putative FmdB family regulatory protein